MTGARASKNNKEPDWTVECVDIAKLQRKTATQKYLEKRPEKKEIYTARQASGIAAGRRRQGRAG